MKKDKQCLSSNCPESFDATSVMQAKCNGEQSCDWNKESLSLVDPCPATFKYMSIDYRCEKPQKPEPEVAMAPIGMSLEFNAPEKTGKNCQDILAKDLSLKKLT